MNEAFAAVAAKMGTYNMDAAGAMNSMPTTNFGTAVTQAQATLKDKESLIASHGLTLGDFIPSALMITVGFSGSGNFYIGGAAQGVICFILMPVKDTWMMSGDPTVYSQWSYHVNVTFLAGASVGTGVGGGANWAVGAGAIWGTLPDLSALQGPMVGIWGTGTLGVGLEADLFLLQHSSDPTNVSLAGGDTNILAYGMWTVGAEASFAIHIAGGVAFNLPEVLTAFGLANGNLTGLLHSTGGSSAAPAGVRAAAPRAPVGRRAEAPAAPPAGARGVRRDRAPVERAAGSSSGSAPPPATSGSDDAGAPAASATPDCTGVADGTYCGGDGVTGDSSTLYQCASGAVSATTPVHVGMQRRGQRR